MSRVLLTVAVMTSLIMVIEADPAAACSCATPPIGEALDVADGAFIGTLLSRGEAVPDDEGLIETGQEVDFVFEVQTWVKGDLEPGEYVVKSPSDGGACGFELDVGSTAAILVYVRNGAAHGGLCDTHSAASLRALVDPGPISSEPGRYITRSPATILDEDGRVVSIRELPEGEGRDGMKPCGGPLIAETGHDEVVITDIRTWEVVERLEFARSTRELHCHGDRIVAIAGPRGERSVWDVRTRMALTGQLSNGGHADLHGELLAYSAVADDEHPAGVRVLDLDTATDTFVHAVEPISSDLAPAVLRGVQISPDGSRVAFSVLSGEGRAEVSEVYVYTIDGELIAGDVVFDDGGRTFWLSNEELLFRTGKGHALILRASDLAVLADLGPGYWWLSADDGVLYGMSEQQLRVVDAAGSISVMGEIAVGGAVQRLPEPVTVSGHGAAGADPLDVPISSPPIESVYATAAGDATSDDAEADENEGDGASPLTGALDEPETQRAITEVEAAGDSAGPAPWMLLSIGALVLGVLAFASYRRWAR